MLRVATRYIALILLAFVWAEESSAQTFSKVWDYHYGGGYTEFFMCYPKYSTANGHVVLCGVTQSQIGFDIIESSRGYTDIWLCMIDTTGQIIRQKRFGGNSIDNLNTVLQAPDGGFYIICNSRSDSSYDKSQNNYISNEEALWIIKTDSLFNKEWDRTFGAAVTGNSQNSVFWDGCIGSDSCLYLLTDYRNVLGIYPDGDVTDSACNNANLDYLVYKITATGQLLSTRTFGSSSNDCPVSIEALEDGNIIVGGNNGTSSATPGLNSNQGGGYVMPSGCDYTASINGRLDYWVLKIDTGGNVLWNKNYGGIGVDYLMDILPLPDGGALLAGLSDSPVSGDVSQSAISPHTNIFSTWLIRIDSSGNKIWDKMITCAQSSPNFSRTPHLSQTLDGNYLLTTILGAAFNGLCTLADTMQGNQDFWIVKINTSGVVLWDKRWGCRRYNAGYRSLETIEIAPNDFILSETSTGTPYEDQTDSTYLGWEDYWSLRFKFNSNVDVEENNSIALQLSISPNPVKDVCNITANKLTDARFILYDITGRVLMQLSFNAKKEIIMSSLANGVYIAEVRDKEGRSVKGKVVKE